MGQITESMVKFFHEEEWTFNYIEEASTVSMGFSGDNGEWTCYAKADEEIKHFRFYSVCPVKPKENKRQAVSEFLTRANCNIRIGNFELDFADGELRYKTSIDVEGECLSSALIKNLVHINIGTMDTYLPGIMAVIYGNVSPEQAIKTIENQPD